MRLPINSNRHTISYCFGDFAANCSNFGHFAFLSHPLGGLGIMYFVHLGLSGKRVVDFLLVIIELFSLDVTAEALRAKINRKFSLQTRSVWPKISGRRGRSSLTWFMINSNWRPISYCFGDFAAYCSNFGHFAFLSQPLGGLRDNVRCSSWAH